MMWVTDYEYHKPMIDFVILLSNNTQTKNDMMNNPINNSKHCIMSLHLSIIGTLSLSTSKLCTTYIPSVYFPGQAIICPPHFG